MSDSLMCSASETDEMFDAGKWVWEKPDGYRVSRISGDIQVMGDGVVVAELTPESKIWVLDSAMEIFRADKCPWAEYESSLAYFKAKGWDCQPEPLYEGKLFASEKAANDYLSNQRENWGD